MNRAGLWLAVVCVAAWGCTALRSDPINADDGNDSGNTAVAAETAADGAGDGGDEDAGVEGIDVEGADARDARDARDGAVDRDTVDVVVARDVPGVVCGDHVCDGSETNETCAADCPLFTGCASSADCRGGGRVCDNRYPGGLCTRSCTSDAQCGAGICSDQCFPRCSLGGGQCSATQMCRGLAPADSSRRGCLPACYEAPAAGVPGCTSPTAAVCDTGGRVPGCYARARTTGAPDGAPCSVDADCHGICFAELDGSGAATGYVGGQCVTLGRLPPLSMYAAMMPVPRSTCPAGSGAVPLEAMAVEGDVALCLPTCNATTDCRAGYQCSVPRSPLGASSNGVCLAMDCLAPGFVGMCPAGYRCQPNPAPATNGACVRS